MMVRSGPAAAAARVHRMRTMELWAAETTGHWYMEHKEQAGTLASEYAISALTS